MSFHSKEPENDAESLSKNAELFSEIAAAIYAKGYCVIENALPAELCNALAQHARQLPDHDFKPAGVGRGDQHATHAEIRQDSIAWINGDNKVEQQWLRWAAELQACLNQRLFLGLFSFESHFAHYKAGEFYKKHLDAFRGQSNRKLSLVTYLNCEWAAEDGGELRIFAEDGENIIADVLPRAGTLVLFLSEEFPHEVLPAKRDRLSIAGWFRVNNSVGDGVDPPR